MIYTNKSYRHLGPWLGNKFRVWGGGIKHNWHFILKLLSSLTIDSKLDIKFINKCLCTRTLRRGGEWFVHKYFIYPKPEIGCSRMTRIILTRISFLFSVSLLVSPEHAHSTSGPRKVIRSSKHAFFHFSKDNYLEDFGVVENIRLHIIQANFFKAHFDTFLPLKFAPRIYKPRLFSIVMLRATLFFL